jgi:hypothetical protein
MHSIPRQHPASWTSQSQADSPSPRWKTWSARLPTAAATIATYSPANDPQDQTLAADLRIIELLARYAAQN